jgi:hypothetical protein
MCVVFHHEVICLCNQFNIHSVTDTDAENFLGIRILECTEVYRCSEDSVIKICDICKNDFAGSDIEILINGKSARTYASQGQQRSCVLALKLAEAELLQKMTGIEPIALLDDVMSELDRKRRACLIGEISNFQTFITCADRNDVDDEKVDRIWSVSAENGEASVNEIHNS